MVLASRVLFHFNANYQTSSNEPIYHLWALLSLDRRLSHRCNIGIDGHDLYMSAHSARAGNSELPTPAYHVPDPNIIDSTRDFLHLCLNLIVLVGLDSQQSRVTIDRVCHFSL